MTRVIRVFLVAAFLFAAGYGAAGWVADRRVWNEDRLIGQSPVLRAARRGSETPGQVTSEVRFADVAAELGMDFTYYDGAEGKFFLMETTGGGMSVLDFDADGNQDIFMVNGSRLPVNSADLRFHSKLYRNHAEGGLEDVTDEAAVKLVAYGQGAASCDYDNDGFPDFVVACFGRCVLYHNNGDGSFSQLSGPAGVDSTRWCTSAAFSDLDQDGAADLYVCTYTEVSVENPQVCERGGKRTHCLPSLFPAQPDLLWRNLGDGRFEECADRAGIQDSGGRGLGIAIADFNLDDQPDIFVANDTSENYLFVNRQQLRFDESALSLGVALTGSGATMSGMGVACADYDLNGWPDLCVTNFYQERSVLYQNMGPGGFLDSADTTGVAAASRDRLGFGTIFLDADLDGFPDLFVANGHISDMTHLGIPYKMRQQLLRNEAGQRFRDASDVSGPSFHLPRLGRGVARLDINNDGLPDLVVSHIMDPAALLLNRSDRHGHWLGIELVGTRSLRDGSNTKLLLTRGGQNIASEAVAGCGYLSSSDNRLLFGLGDSTLIDSVELHWPSGAVQKLQSPRIDQYHKVIESRGDSTQ